MGGGNDRISYTSAEEISTIITINKVGDEIHIIGPNTKDIMTGVQDILNLWVITK